MTFLGGREIHPINVKVGGFYKMPARRDLLAMAEQLKRARDIALADRSLDRGLRISRIATATTSWCRSAIRTNIPFNEGRIVSNRGLDISAHDYDAHFEEIHVAHSNALQARIRDRGALSRRAARPLRPELRQAVAACPRSARMRPASRRSATTPTRASSCARSRCSTPATRRSASSRTTRSRIGPPCRSSRGPAPATPPPRRRAACSITATSSLTTARSSTRCIVPPTSQNQASIEEDLKILINGWLDLPDDELRHRCEQTVRNYDPCISCATHFLDLRIDRG